MELLACLQERSPSRPLRHDGRSRERSRQTEGDKKNHGRGLMWEKIHACTSPVRRSVGMCSFPHLRLPRGVHPLMSLIAAPVVAALGFCLFDDCGPAAQVANRRVSRNRLPGRSPRCSVTVAVGWGLQGEAGEPAAF